jgi:hypothetical protein
MKPQYRKTQTVKIYWKSAEDMSKFEHMERQEQKLFLIKLTAEQTQEHKPLASCLFSDTLKFKFKEKSMFTPYYVWLLNFI